MKEKSNFQLNNNGSTLVIVLIMVAFITILSTVVTTTAMTNLKMKMVNKESTKTFYTVEDAVDEIYAALGKTSMECFDAAYTQRLSQIVSEENNNKTVKQNVKYNEQLRTGYMDNVITALLGNSNIVTKSVDSNGVVVYVYSSNETDVNNFKELLNSYLEDKAGGIQIKSLDKVELTNERSNADTTLLCYTFSFTNCVVEYESESGYYSNITFNGSVGMPDSIIDFITINTEGLDAFTGYSIIGNTGVIITGSEDGVTGNVSINGNVYAGKGDNVGLTVDSSARLSLYNGRVVSAGDVILNNNASLASGSTDMWCDNILIRGNHAALNIGSGSETYVKDDLQIDGNSSSVSVAGNYYGYGYKSENNTNPHSSLSAVIINGKNVNLDFSRINTLVIAGSAYIDYSQKMLATKYGNTNSLLNGGNAYYNTGNSLDYIGAQEIYLVPTTLMGDDGKEPNPNSAADVKVNLTTDSFFGYKYLNLSTPYITKTIDGKVYYYLNFRDSDSIQAYVKAVLNEDTYNELKQEQAADSETRQINYDTTRSYVSGVISVNLTDLQSYIAGLNNSTVHTNGALIVASKGGDQSITASLLDKDGSYNYQNDNTYFSKMYLALKKALITDETLISGSYVDNNLYSNIVNNEKLLEVTAGGAYKPDTGVTDGKLIYVTNNSRAVSVGGTGDITGGLDEGIVIASGDVAVNKNFNGMIIAGGKITVQGSAAISNTMSGTTVKSLIQRNDILKTILKGWSTGEAEGTNTSDVQVEDFTYKDLVNISDWRKG